MMRFNSFILASVLLLSGAVAAYAAGDHKHADGPCKSYFESCKTGNKMGKEMFKCVHDAATTANDKACLDDMAKHGKGHHGDHGDHGADAAPKGE